MKSRLSLTLVLAGLAVALALSTIAIRAEAAHARVRAVYVAHLTAMNANIVGGKTAGEARFELRGGNLVIDIKVSGAPPNITHWQHFHGFKDGSAATCATP